jgi:hypothetical protein
VANPRDTGPDSSDQIQRSELNPLTNPTLERNLGRWAQVYFTNPPEKREQAVSELLCELNGKSPEGSAPADHNAGNTSDGPTLQPELVCPACRQKITATERFCGACGFALQDRNMPEAENHRPVRAEGQTSASVPQFSAENDLDWLRERAVIRLDERPAPSRRQWKYPFMGLAILLAGFAYVLWSSRPHPPASVPEVLRESAPQVAPEPAKPAQPTPPSEPAAIQTTPAIRANVNQTPAASDAATEAGNGAPELLLAQGYLAGKNGPRDTAVAAKWLWKAVGKKNTSAVLLLADLYMLGDGVPRDCDQARLLLVAAARKGTTEAAQKLRRLESAGCPQ